MKQLKDKLMSEMDKPDMNKKSMSKDEVKMMMLQHLRDAMDDMMKDDMSEPNPLHAAHMAKVSVMAQDPEHMQEGLQKAQDLVKADKFHGGAAIPTDHEQELMDHMESDEDEEMEPSDDTEMHEKDNLEDDEDESHPKKYGKY